MHSEETQKGQPVCLSPSPPFFVCVCVSSWWLLGAHTFLLVIFIFTRRHFFFITQMYSPQK